MGELRVENLGKSFQRKEGWNTTRTLRVFDNVSFAVREGEFVSLIGPSGCGKSTLLNLSAGLDQANGGFVYVDGHEVQGPGLDRGVVFQEFALFPWLTVIGNIEFGLRSKGVPAAERRVVAKRYVKLVGLSGFENFHPYRLSGGMRQRVGIARALAIEPSVLLMDEPFGALDAQTRESMQKALGDIWQATRKTVLFVTHDIREAVYLSDRVLVMSGRPADITLEMDIDLSRPRNRHDTKFQDYERRLEQAIGPPTS
ncbi:MAG TPA: ABC transporter ATP-binding protein [Pseudolabrys sp.]|nr:ABC transporter ATP-binding protein [Pseudolabrys sp.]